MSVNVASLLWGISWGLSRGAGLHFLPHACWDTWSFRGIWEILAYYFYHSFNLSWNWGYLTFFTSHFTFLCFLILFLTAHGLVVSCSLILRTSVWLLNNVLIFQFSFDHFYFLHLTSLLDCIIPFIASWVRSDLFSFLFRMWVLSAVYFPEQTLLYPVICRF